MQFGTKACLRAAEVGLEIFLHCQREKTEKGSPGCRKSVGVISQ